MSQAVIASNVSLKVNRAITGATTVNTNCYAVVTYLAGSLNFLGGSGAMESYSSSITRYFGPSQSIPASFNVTGATNYSVTFNLASGVEFINSP